MDTYRKDQQNMDGVKPSTMPSTPTQFPGKQAPPDRDMFMERNGVNGVHSEESMTKEIPAFDAHTSEPGGPQSKFQAKLEPEMYVEGGKRFPRISKPVELLRPEYDVIVVGSGYGGGVAASRMARGGQSVCLLELGKERWRRFYHLSIRISPRRNSNINSRRIPQQRLGSSTASACLRGIRA